MGIRSNGNWPNINEKECAVQHSEGQRLGESEFCKNFNRVGVGSSGSSGAPGAASTRFYTDTGGWPGRGYVSTEWPSVARRIGRLFREQSVFAGQFVHRFVGRRRGDRRGNHGREVYVARHATTENFAKTWRGRFRDIDFVGGVFSDHQLQFHLQRLRILSDEFWRPDRKLCSGNSVFPHAVARRFALFGRVIWCGGDCEVVGG